MLPLICDHLDDLKPKDFYKKFDYSYNSRKNAEEKLQELLTTIANERNSSNHKKATFLLNSFEVMKFHYWLIINTLI